MPSDIFTDPVTFIDPVVCNEPESNIKFDCPIVTMSAELVFLVTSSNGNPLMSFTANRDPWVRLSDTENNVPSDPITLNTVEPEDSTVKDDPDNLDEPVASISKLGLVPVM